jgi:hypothetical protein
MLVRSALLGTLLGVLLLTAADPTAAQSVRLADGNDWRKSSDAE